MMSCSNKNKVSQYEWQNQNYYVSDQDLLNGSIITEMKKHQGLLILES